MDLQCLRIASLAKPFDRVRMPKEVRMDVFVQPGADASRADDLMRTLAVDRKDGVIEFQAVPIGIGL